MFNQKRNIVIAVNILFCVMLARIFLFEKNKPNYALAESVAYSAITNNEAADNTKNIYCLRTLYNKIGNKYWIEFYDTESYPACLWLGSVLIDGKSFKVLHTETDSMFYSGFTPEMAADHRKYQKKLHNEYGDFYLNSRTE